jgi:hypothetical protein
VSSGVFLVARAETASPGCAGAAYCQSSLTARSVDGCRSSLSAKSPAEPCLRKEAVEPPLTGAPSSSPSRCCRRAPHPRSPCMPGVGGVRWSGQSKYDWQCCCIHGRFLGVQAGALRRGAFGAAYCQSSLTARSMDGCRSSLSAKIRAAPCLRKEAVEPPLTGAPSSSPSPRHTRRSGTRGAPASSALVRSVRYDWQCCRADGRFPGVQAGRFAEGAFGAAYCQSSLTARSVDGCRSSLSAKSPAEPVPAKGSG